MRGIKGIGTLNERITIQRQAGEVNDHNEYEVSGWEDVCTVWSRFQDDDSAIDRENFISDQITAERTAKATIRHRTDINEKMRILRRDRYYKIVSISYPDTSTSTVIKAVLLDET